MSYAALPVLRTPRLELRPLTDQDTDAFVAGVGNYDVSRWLGAVPYPYDPTDARRFVETVHAGALQVWGVEDKTGLVGTISSEDRLGYWLARPVWRRGYAFEACHAVIAHWFADPGNAELSAGFFEGNLRSEAVLRALGFKTAAFGTTFAKSLNQDVNSVEVVLSRKQWEARQSFILFTPRLTLRPIKDSDAQALIELAQPEVTRMLFSLKTGLDRKEALEFITARQWAGLPGFVLAIEQGGDMIGYVACADGPLELYYALHPDCWGGGLMTEALSAFLPELFERFPATRIHADRFEDNPASGAILRKFGFEETGRNVGRSLGRLEPAPVITYALYRDNLRVPA